MSTTKGPSGLQPSVSDAFLKVVTDKAGKVKGEVTTEGHEGEIDIDSWSFGVAASTAIGSGQATGKRQYETVVFKKRIDSASTPLLSALATNDVVKEARLTLRKAGGEEVDYFVMTLTQARVVRVDIDMAFDGMPIETVGFTFAEIDIEYQTQQSSGIRGASSVFHDQWGINT